MRPVNTFGLRLTLGKRSMADDDPRNALILPAVAAYFLLFFVTVWAVAVVCTRLHDWVLQ